MALYLPTPEQLTADLLKGEGIEVNGHYMIYESDEQCVWFTNPYGVDGILCAGPTVEKVRSFLLDMAHGKETARRPKDVLNDD